MRAAPPRSIAARSPHEAEELGTARTPRGAGSGVLADCGYGRLQEAEDRRAVDDDPARSEPAAVRACDMALDGQAEGAELLEVGRAGPPLDRLPGPAVD